MSVEVAARLKQIREKFGLSQRELAKRAGVTNSTISLIEQNKVSPSVSSLKKVLDGIPISMADFFTLDIENDPSDTPFYTPEEQPDVGSNDIHYFLVGHRRPQRQMCVLREVMPPGTDTGEVMITHEGEEGGVVLEGQVEITVGEQVRVLGPGEAYYFECRIPHRFRNVGNTNVVIVSASTPPTF